MASKYLYASPRGFANEFSIYRVAPEEITEAQAMIDAAADDPGRDVHWITRQEAERITAANRKLAKERLEAGMSLRQNPVGATEIIAFSQRGIGR